MTLAFIDFETRGPVEIKTFGGYNYAHHPETEIILAALAIDGEPVRCFEGADAFEQMYVRIPEDAQIVAWNASFEEQLFRARHREDEIYCAAAHAREYGLPSSLRNASFFIDSEVPKLDEGRRLIKKFCFPPFAPLPGPDVREVTLQRAADGSYGVPRMLPDPDWALFKEYCIRDVEAMRLIWSKLPLPTPVQMRDYRVSEIINRRGVPIDDAYLKAAIPYAARAQEQAEKFMLAELGLKPRSPKVVDWVYAQPLSDEAKDLLIDRRAVTRSKKGISLNARTRKQLLARDDIPQQVRLVIEAVEACSASSISKMQKMRNVANADRRVRGLTLYYGANPGRFASHTINWQNTARQTMPTAAIPRVKDLVMEGADPAQIEEVAGEPLMNALRSTLRACITPAEGYTFLCLDWSQIEGRVLPWLAMHPVGDAKVRAFGAGDDIYRVIGGQLLNKPPEALTSHERLVYGKVPELSLGFGGGPTAINQSCDSYNVPHFPLKDRERIVKLWRNKNSWAPSLWYGLMDAARKAFRQPGRPVQVKRCTYIFQQHMLGGALLCRLPVTGRYIVYPYFRVQGRECSYRKCAIKPPVKLEGWKWPRTKIWHGTLAENVTQGVASDVLRETLAELQDLRICMHSHDEILLEVPIDEVETVRKRVEEVMSRDWVDKENGGLALPLACEGWVGDFYRK